MSWAWLLAVVWVVLVAAAVADGVCFVGVRRCGLFAGRGVGRYPGLFVVVFGVDGAGFSYVR